MSVFPYFLFIHIFKTILFIYFWLCWSFVAVRAFLQLQRVGSTLCCRAWASHCSCFSCCRAWALDVKASVVEAHGLSSCGIRALEHRISDVADRLSYCMTCGIFLGQGLNLCLLHWRRRQWHPSPVLLPGKSHGRRSLVGCSPWGLEESDTTEWLHFHFSLFTFMHWRRKWQPTPVFLPGESQGRGSLVAAVYGVTQSRTRLKWLSSSCIGRWVLYLGSLNIYMLINVIIRLLSFSPTKL